MAKSCGAPVGRVVRTTPLSIGRRRRLHRELRAPIRTDAGGPIHPMQEGFREQQLAVGAVQHIEEPVPIRMQQQLPRLSAIFGIDQDRGLGCVAVCRIVRRELEVPFQCAGLGVEGEYAIGEEIIARAVAIVAIRPGIAGWPSRAYPFLCRMSRSARWSHRRAAAVPCPRSRCLGRPLLQEVSSGAKPVRLSSAL